MNWVNKENMDNCSNSNDIAVEYDSTGRILTDILENHEEPDMPEKHCCSHKTKHRTNDEQRALINRLNRIEGQVRGIKGMIENNAYCTDILTQVAAVNSALNSFNKELLASHIKTCVAEDIRSGNDETIDELVKILQKLMK